MTDCNLLQYNDFYGSVEFSAPDECFFGKIIGIADLVTFEGESVDNLKKAFTEAVDDYLVLCKEAGKEPMKSYKGSFNIRISPDLHRAAAVIAGKKGVSLNTFVEKAIYDEVSAGTG
ncbi:MAG: type II toxin-antitoxin system HicB family antitoxin [Treponema sp.]|jgi:predicted HicB family RNase H-like nuclease|nr:type II toxin-antitoxin system HicB family antitoxin [Treponema sp.]